MVIIQHILHEIEKPLELCILINTIQITECSRCKQPAEVKCTNPTCAQMKKEYLCRRCDIAYHNPSYVSRDGHKRVSIIEAGKFGQ